MKTSKRKRATEKQVTNTDNRKLFFEQAEIPKSNKRKPIIKNKNWLTYKTIITQEMLKKGFLASTVCYLSTAHDSSIFDSYAENQDKVFHLISKFDNFFSQHAKIISPRSVSNNGKIV